MGASSIGGFASLMRRAMRVSGTAIVAAVAVVLCVACGPSGETSAAKPDAKHASPPTSVLLITLDTTRPDHLSCYGYARPTSPAIDALAVRGARFERAWSLAPETGPSLATVLTSRVPPDTRVRGNAERLDASLPTLATAAKSAGMRTGAFVSTVLLRRDACAFDRGFDVYDDTMTDPCFGHDRAQRIGERTADAAIAWLRADERPFLAWVHLYDPHGPYTPPVRTGRLDASRAGVPSRTLDARSIPRYQRTGTSLDAADYIDRYDHEIAYADAQIARILAAVDPAKTLVIVHADHGESLLEDGYTFRHGSLLHDAALRVPLILAGPGVSPGRVVAEDVRLLDVAPTVLTLAGLAPLPGAEGHDLAAVVRDAARGSDRDGARGDVGDHVRGTEARVPPMTLVAEARKREIVADQTGIDCAWKLRVISPALGLDRTGHGALHGVSSAAKDDLPAFQWLGATDRWRAPEPKRAATPSAPSGTTPEMEEALRGLGYR